MSGNGGVRVVLASYPDKEAALAAAERLVGMGLAACMSVVAGTSVYRWEGETKRAGEWLAFAKTSASMASDLVAAIAESHPYEVPEVLVLPVEGGWPPYLDWVLDATPPACP